MIEQTLINEISNAIIAYRQSISRTNDQQEIEDYSTLAIIAEKILTAAKINDVEKIKIGIFGFSRQVSDSYSSQPSEYRTLANLILKLQKTVCKD